MNVPAVRALGGSVWAALLLVLTAWACSVEDPEPGAAATENHAESGHGTEAEGPQRSIEVRNGEVVGGVQQLEVSLGESVTIEVLSDEADEMHVHGYDLAEDLEAGEPGAVTFDADIPGEFDVELEDHHLSLIVLRVR
ncbi:hypothetical protein BJ993_002075 [Nocardioides aromaticivorans]|uniref:EfeO-type cupredoxin-like domain-containing protein n=1 Tax=Nocardioides aromaticivorans TaxID=200618 RepID=A0A7Y9ZJA9_9ACTN|nr:hypothetical protein [Nocardioides aromaticivorans]NYI44995.1 hypothetical protein [Nocardioides aromaticivorans]